MQSVWEDSVKDTGKNRKKLTGDITTDVLIIGGGMAGILCAYRLMQYGIPCIVVEAKEVGSGVTRNTTAKITSQHGLIYADLMRMYGAEKARQYYDINERALAEYRTLAESIPCDIEEKTAYIYSTDDKGKLDREAEAYSRLGIPMHFQEYPPLPIGTVGALGLEHQAYFNPLKLLMALSERLEIYEDTIVTEITGHIAVTKQGRITAKHMILATHFPLVNIPGLYFVKLYQHRSYVLALQNAPELDGMYVDERQDGHSFRNYKDLLLIGGGDHRTGKRGGGYEELLRLAGHAYPDKEVRFAWATQDCMTLDGLPYIGLQRRSARNIYVATGFNKWGMTGSMAAAIVLADLIRTGDSEYADLLSPQRSMLHPQLFLNVLHAVAGLASFGKRCPHMGCALKWNEQEHTWDCPCHGSRFDKEGSIINNPTKRGIPVE